MCAGIDSLRVCDDMAKGADCDIVHAEDLDYVLERLHKSDGMARDVNILVRENRALATERDQLKREVAALKNGKWAGPWESDADTWNRLTVGDREESNVAEVIPRIHDDLAGKWRWFSREEIGNYAPTLEAAKAAADAALISAGWWLSGEVKS